MTGHFRPQGRCLLRRAEHGRLPGSGPARPPGLLDRPLGVAAAVVAIFLVLVAGLSQAQSEDNTAAPQAAPAPAAEPAAPAAAAPAGDNEATALAPPAAPVGQLKEVRVTRTPHYTNIEVQVDGKVGTYNSFKLSDPFRIVVDIPGVDRGTVIPDVPVDTPQVRAVRLSQQDGRLRIIVETPEDRPLPYFLTPDEDRIVISVGGGREEKVTSMDREPEKKAPVKGPAVLGVDVEDLPETANVVVTTAGDAPYRETDKKRGSVTLLFPGARAEKALLREMDATKMDIPVRKVTPAAVKGGTRVTIRFEAGSEYRIEKRGNAVVVAFPKKPAAGKETMVAALREKRVAAPSRTAAAPTAPGAPGRDAVAPTAKGPAQPVWGFVTHEGEERRYVGQRISLDFKDADLANVFRILAEVSDLNIITTEDVKGKISLRLVNVPWDQALDIILRSKGLGAKLDGNILRIAPLATLRAEEKARLDSIREVEKIQASVEGVVETIPVSYGKASDLQGKIKDLLSEGGKTQIDDRTNTIVVRDLRRNVQEIKALIEILDTPTPQVLIEARIVEVDTTYSHELGVQWGGIKQGTVDGGVYGVSGTQNAGGAFISGLPISNTPDPFATANYAVNLPAAVGVGSGGGIAFGLIRNSFRLDLVLTALEAAGKGKVVSSPRVVTIDNREAVIEQGTQIPYSTVSASGTNTQFVDAVLSLRVTPHITPEGSVVMRIEAKNDSQGATGATGQPAINKKKATTEVLVRDGDTTVIGGILQISRNENESGVPWFSKIPILGFFFKKNQISSTNRELLIFITPKVIKPEPLQARSS